MASVAVPMVASFVVNKVGESQGWDKRLTGVLSAAASFGAGSLYSAGQAMAASGATTASGVGALNAGINSATGAANVGSAAARSAAISGGFSPAAAWGSRAAALGQSAAPFASGYAGASTAPLDAVTSANQSMPIKNYYTTDPLTMSEAWGNEIDDWKTRPTDDQGNETGMSGFENFGVSALKTLMQEPANQAPSGGGGGGGPSAPAYQGGGGGQYQTVWSFGQPNQGYKPQGI